MAISDEQLKGLDELTVEIVRAFDELQGDALVEGLRLQVQGLIIALSRQQAVIEDFSESFQAQQALNEVITQSIEAL